MNLSLITVPSILSVYSKKQYKLYEGVNYLNVFGIRSSAGLTNTFDDAICIMYKDDKDTWQLKAYNGTTDPGLYWMEHPMNVVGTAIVVPGQYIASHIVGLHHGQYRALVQHSPIKVYRDSNKDKTYDYDLHTVQDGMFGINIHRASPDHVSTYNDKWSAGCSVIADPKDFGYFMFHVDAHVEMGIYDNTFSYTLCEEKDLG
jgi:hypothetical protein